MTTDFRALCAELLTWAERTSAHYVVPPHVILRARAALSAPEQGPTKEELIELANNHGVSMQDIGILTSTVLSRWGRPAVEPVQGPSEAELKTFACQWWHSWVIDSVAPEHFADFSRDVLARWGRLTVESVPASEWHEDIGNVLWWRFPIEEPPYVGSPLDTDWPGYHTHFTLLPVPQEAKQ